MFRSSCIAAVLLVALFAGRSGAEEGSQAERPAKQSPGGGFFLELGGARDPDLIGGTIGIEFSVDRSTTLVGLGFFASDACKDLMTGLSLEYQVRAFRKKLVAVNPWVGIGAFAGYSREEVDADDDHIDNDDDGEVDEDGETDEEVNDVLAAIYPEAGINVLTYDPVVLSVAARYYVTTKGRSSDNLAYLFGIRFLF